ncbi:MAG TPA: hypothetical protein VKO18_02330 [Terriglobia bacterium]|nr:hypothetical protein [Terriglobia bacterium]
MKGLFHVMAALSSATMSLGAKTVKRVAPVVVGAAIVLAAYLTLTGLMPPALRSKAQVHPGLKSPALLGLNGPLLPGLRSALSLPKVHAQGCGNGNGTLYGYYEGYSFSSTGQSVNLYYFNGAGGISSGYYESSNSGGVSGEQSGISGTYSVGLLCTGTMSISTGGTFDLVVVSNGAQPEVDLVPTNSGSQFMEILKPWAANGNCTDETIAGNWGGYSLNSTSESIDKYSFNGSGGVTGTYAGASGSGNFTGTYSCPNGTMSISTPGTFAFMVVENGSEMEIDMISTNKGSSFWEILKPLE